MLTPLLQPHGLNGKNFITPLLPLLWVGGDKGEGRKTPHKPGLLLFQGKRNHTVTGIFPADKGIHPSALHTQLVNVNVPVHDLTLELLFPGKNRTVFRNNVMPSEHQVLGGFSLAAAAIDIACDQPCAGGLHQHFPVSILADGLIGSRKVHQKRCPRHGMGNPRLVGSPNILADFAPGSQALHPLCP